MKFVVLDAETTGLNWRKDQLHGIGVSSGKEPRYFPASSVPQLLRDVLADPTVHKIGQNIRFDLRFLAHNGFKIAGPLWDLKSLAELCDENQSLGLKEMSLKYLGPESLSNKAELDRAIALAKGKHVGDLCRFDLDASQDQEPPYQELIARYCIEDVRNTLALFKLFWTKLKTKEEAQRRLLGVSKTPLDYLKQEAMPLEPALLAMELRGLRVDQSRIDQARFELANKHLSLKERLDMLCTNEINKIEEQLLEVARSKRRSAKGKAKVKPRSEKQGTRFLWTSGQHVGQLIQKLTGSQVLATTKSGLVSTAEKDLLKISQAPATPLFTKQVISTLLEFKETQKLLTTYVGDESGMLSLVEDGRLYSEFVHGGGPVTGRLASRNPNMQNLPRSGGVKKFFVPDPGHVFLYFDYSQVELRIAAHLSKDPLLMEGYLKGIDLHALTAKNIFRLRGEPTKEQRQVGKTINFAMIYNAGAYRLAEELNKNGAKYSEEQTEEMRQAFFNTYGRYKQYLREQLNFVERHGVVVSESGRLRRLPDVRYKEGINWARRIWQGSPQLMQGLKDKPEQILTPEECFWRAKKKFNHAIKMAYNFPVQSLGATITKRALVQLHREGWDLAGTVHDSITIQVKQEEAQEALAKIRITLENIYPLTVPLVCEGKVLTSLDESDKIDLVDDRSALTKGKFE